MLCPYDVHHRVPRASLERHAASCRLRRMGYSAEEEVGARLGKQGTGLAARWPRVMTELFGPRRQRCTTAAFSTKT